MSNFQRTMTRRPGRSAFNLSHEVKQSVKMSALTPFYIEEVIPGDRFEVKSEILMRFSPLISPVMHRMNLYTHYFYVPNRIIWDGWKDFITGGEDGQNSAQVPRIPVNDATRTRFIEGQLADYLGCPTIPNTPVTDQTYINALPFRAYQEIYNEYYRDQNLQAKVDFSHGDTIDNGEADILLQIKQRNWEKDYFTSSLPWAQKGDPVGIPVDFNYKPVSVLYENDGSAPPQGTNLEAGTALEGGAALQETPPTGNFLRVENLEEEGVSVTIEELRRAVRLQEWLEKNARAGSRYIESILSHFGVRVSDYTAQRPVFLGGGKQPVQISEVLQTSATNQDSTTVDPSIQGNMAGHGISVGGQNSFRSSFKEHGYVIGIMSTLPRSAYSQGVNRMWLKLNKFDYYWPEFAQLGEQEVQNQEVYFDLLATEASRTGTFGYQSRYAEYKYKPSRIAGQFRTTLAHWHMGRQFTALPVLNDQFVKADPRTDIFAVTDEDEDKLFVQIYNNVKAVRPIPANNVPTL